MPFYFGDSEIVAAPLSVPPAVVLLDVQTAAELARLPADPDAGYGLCWGASRDCRRVITRDGDAVIGVWDLVAVRRQLAELGLDW